MGLFFADEETEQTKLTACSQQKCGESSSGLGQELKSPTKRRLLDEQAQPPTPPKSPFLSYGCAMGQDGKLIGMLSKLSLFLVFSLPICIFVLIEFVFLLVL
jgi:hypothetical protein